MIEARTERLDFHPRSSILNPRIRVGKLIWKSAGVKLQRK